MARFKLPGVVSGLGVTFRTMMEGAVTVQYPHEREDPPTRARGVIALKEENCTVCMLCARQCPDWHLHRRSQGCVRRRREGGRPRSVSILDRFDIDYALCMYCGICVEVCPFDAPSGALYEYPNPASPSSCTTSRSSVSGWRRCLSPSRSSSAPRSRAK